MLVHVGCTAQLILMDPWLLCQFRRRFLNITFDENKTQQKNIPSWELTYPTLGKGKSSTQKCRLVGAMLVPWRVSHKEEQPTTDTNK